ncbi:hypothetical protein PAMP_004176 [Pampus punctatissimus]
MNQTATVSHQVKCQSTKAIKSGWSSPSDLKYLQTVTVARTAIWELVAALHKQRSIKRKRRGTTMFAAFEIDIAIEKYNSSE